MAKNNNIVIIDNNTITPMYEQLQEDLYKRIKNGEFKYNERIPTEKQLTAEYNVSIITVRRAIKELVDEGILQKKQGKGTFVSKLKLQRDLNQVISFTEACKQQGSISGGTVLEKKLIVPNAIVTKKLGYEKNDKVVYISRLRFLDGDPVVIETNQFPLKYSFLLGEDLENKSLFVILKQKNNTVVKYSKREITIVKANPSNAKLLNVPENEPLLLQNTVALTENYEPVFVGTQLINSERFILTF